MRLLLLNSLIVLAAAGPFRATGQTEAQRVDSMMRSMSMDQKIGQLLMIPVQATESQEVMSILDRYQPGSMLLTGGTPGSVRTVVRRAQSRSGIPLLVAMHSEWGPAQVLDSIGPSPKAVILAAASSDSLAFLAGRRMARQLRDLGVHMAFAIHADTDLPSTGSMATNRYFSNDPVRLVRIAGAWMRGIQREQVLGILKHIPGSQEVKTLDVYRAGLDPVSENGNSFLPFRELLQQGADGILTSWLHYSVQDGNRKKPAPLADGFIPTVLRDRLNFKGLTVAESEFFRLFQTDGFRLRRTHPARSAFLMGHDMILVDRDVPRAVRQIRKAIRGNKKLEKELDQRVRRVLAAKVRAGLMDGRKFIASPYEAFATEALHQTIRESAVTVVRDSMARLPIVALDERRFVHLVFSKQITPAPEWLAYAHMQPQVVAAWSDTLLLRGVRKQDVVVAEFSDDNHITPAQAESWLKKVDNRCNLVVVHFGNPYELKMFAGLSTVVEGYDPSELRSILPQVIFGALPASGSLPVISAGLPDRLIRTSPIERLSFGTPEQAGMSSQVLARIDEIAREAIASGATPGARVLAVRKGRVVVDRSYGHYEYDRREPVHSGTLYDLASVTKVSATLQSTMFLHDRGIIDIRKKASQYLPELSGTNKKDFTLKDILTHQSGLWPFLPFWNRTMKDSVWVNGYYADQQNVEYPFTVADRMYAHRSMRDSLWQWILRARIGDRNERTPFEYRYSDMGFYILQHLSERLLNQPLEDFLEQNIYAPLGAYTLGYLPLQRFPPSDIAPTENDHTFRKSLLRGYVHDQGAAMHGGVAGHAGLFGSAYDMAKLGQMWLRKGFYGGHRYFQPETLEFFTARQFATSRRGLGWDKPLPGDPNGPTSILASPSTFGHTGFTGTCIWVDPEHDLVYVFLSNRVHPDMTNNKLLNANIRPRIQDVLYQAILSFDRENLSLF